MIGTYTCSGCIKKYSCIDYGKFTYYCGKKQKELNRDSSWEREFLKLCKDFKIPKEVAEGFIDKARSMNPLTENETTINDRAWNMFRDLIISK